MPDHTHVKTETVDGVLLATVLDSTVSDYESEVILHDIAQDAPDAAWRIVLDLGRIELLTSAGIGMLIKLLKRCRQEKGKLVICSLSSEIHGLLKTTRVDRLFDFQPDVQKALKRARR